MQIGGFFGLTGFNLLLSHLSKKQFIDMVNSLDTNTNRIRLVVLKEELNHILSFLEHSKRIYDNPEAIKAERALKFGRTLDGQELSQEARKSLQDLISNTTKSISRQQVSADGDLVTLDDNSYKVMQFLSQNERDLKFYLNHLSVTSDEISTQNVLGAKLYILKIEKRSTLINRFLRAYDTGIDYERLTKEVDILLQHFDTEDTPKVNSNILKVVDDITPLVTTFDENQLNDILDLDLDKKGYVDLSTQLEKVGLIGLTPFTPELFQIFMDTCGLHDASDLTITPSCDLYRFTLDLVEVLNDYKFFKKGED